MSAASQAALEEEVNRKIKDFILSYVLPGESPANLKDDTPLRTGGILDSISTLRLFQFIESQFEIEVSIGDANSSSFNSVGDIVTYIVGKKANT